MYERILLATDGSKHSRHAAKMAFDMAKLSKGAITAVYVADPGRYFSAMGDVSFNIADDVVEGIKSAVMEEGEAALRYIEEEAKLSGIKTVTKLIEGNPADEILKMSEGKDIILVGSIGVSGMERFLIGSVAEKIVRNSRIPVLVVR